jgi:hypothetical protein
VSELKSLKFMGHHNPDEMMRRVINRSATEGSVWVSHWEHAWNGLGEPITKFYVQPLPFDESRIELVSGLVFVSEDAVEPGGPEGGLRLKPGPKPQTWGVPRGKR